MMGAREDEKEFAIKWAKENNVTLKITSKFLNDKTYSMIKGFDGLSLQQTMGLPTKMYTDLKNDGFKQIAQRSAGFDMYNLEEARKQGIKITNVPAYSPNSVAEFVVASALNAVRHLNDIESNVSKHDFRWSAPIMSNEIQSLTIGILGTGRIGQVVAKIFKGFGAKVIGYDLFQNESAKKILTYENDFDKFVKKSNILTIHTPLTQDNYHMFNDNTFKKMTPGTILINAARGAIVDTKSMMRALDSGQLKFCAMDTYENEMPYVTYDWSKKHLEDPLLNEIIKRDDIQYTPHIAFYTDVAVKNLVYGGLNACLEILETGNSKSIVN
ncbi:hypothetical protein RV02_GL002883 [Enterococcus gilvus]|uniref:D-lactate dehydrogenase n=2 Tax=Enterococcus gilvus TaxID=160453 RepID=R2XBG4_9ENTE|nr:hypothetical protein UKC_04085 [Enterococcus gilvus ATCC BAA-350]EOW78454.1 hypothetical protein I592_04047 [Enterococcus gilvus ATCC BAA-350]OJG38655.1 hypothetical protein RV02_GL002883 [Enterococcus gilvus]